MYPINSQPPALSPPTPPQTVSPVETDYNHSQHLSYNHPGAPPPLSSLPHRQHADASSQIIVTPNDPGQQQQQMARAVGVDSLDDRSMIDPSLGSMNEDGYFEGVVGLKNDGTAMINSSQDYARFNASSPHSLHHHPYRRTPGLTPGQSAAGYPSRPYQPSGLGTDGKPVFAMPFAPSNGLLAPPMDVGQMDKGEGPDGSDPATWQRWYAADRPAPQN